VRCPLAVGRTQVVYGEGPADAKIAILGEAPGEDEDRQGRPFLGRSGRTLDRLLAAAKIDRPDSYVTNTVLCRPESNRKPRVAEVMACAQHLEQQLKIVRPRVLVTLGAVALARMLGPGHSVERDHGRPFRVGDVIVVPTFHPAALPRRAGRLEAVVEDLRVARRLAGLGTPAR
jgi:uracil-DNA glycosylase